MVLACLEDDNALRIGVTDWLSGGGVRTWDWPIVVLEIGGPVALHMTNAIWSHEPCRYAAIEENIALKGLAGCVASGKAFVQETEGTN